MGSVLGMGFRENGALMIVVWNAIILHCRWGGFVKDRGIVILALFGNVVTAWSWFGVNMLGIGLHSYGFMDSALMLMVCRDANPIDDSRVSANDALGEWS